MYVIKWSLRQQVYCGKFCKHSTLCYQGLVALNLNEEKFFHPLKEAKDFRTSY